jgi:hypothetical protein
MLANLLPGLRDLRTPLAVGYLWLTGLWLLISDRVLRAAEVAPSGLIKGVYRLEGFLGPSAALSALSFVAYLIGIMLLWRINWNVLKVDIREVEEESLLFPRLRTKLFIFFRLPNAFKISELLDQINDTIRRRMRERIDATKGKFSLKDHQKVTGVRREPIVVIEEDGRKMSDIAELYIRATELQLPEVGIRLQGENRDLWDTFDRSRAESEFRSAVALPLAFVIIVVSLKSTLWCLLLLLVPIWLLNLAMRKSVEATSALIQALALTKVQPPIFERLDEALARKEADLDITNERGSITERGLEIE